MAINLQNALRIAKKFPATYEFRINEELGYTNVIRYTREKSGRCMSRKQTFNSESGQLERTERRINCNYAIYSSPSSGIFGLQYFSKIKDPNSFFGYHLKRVYEEIFPKSLAEIRQFLKKQAENMH